MKQMAKAISLGLTVVLGLTVPVLIGVYVDKQMQTKPAGVLIGFVIGALCAFGALWEMTRP